jgi:hypothetical protein
MTFLRANFKFCQTFLNVPWLLRQTINITMATKIPKKQNKQPGIEAEMDPRPEYIKPNYKAAGKLMGKVALITGGDSGIGRAVAVHYAREGADVGIVYLNEDVDALETQREVERVGRKCLLLKGDVKKISFC